MSDQFTESFGESVEDVFSEGHQSAEIEQNEDVRVNLGIKILIVYSCGQTYYTVNDNVSEVCTHICLRSSIQLT